MAHSLLPGTPAAATAISTRSTKNPSLTRSGFHRVRACNQSSGQAVDHRLFHRRFVGLLRLGLVGAFVVGGLNVDDRKASAATRRPPPPPPTEKKDPNVSGVTAKILASKKRKEAMKNEVAKLKEKGKLVNKPSE
ncbi:hypothetical protein RJ639_016997 [Escallonia herrerae]|uniref:Uncharacterized protein n=1 Tax=Escallonia herrerae TaxID=1293975 RepID=A0AA89AN38_9ASTE|nr:hypothetical protein RJ639_016997 [Escallonia herrerae]